MAVHPAARGFDDSAPAYERARPGYPPEVVQGLVELLELRPGRTVLDLAAGTGKLTRLLVPTGARVVAVEPLAGMRAELARVAPETEVHEGTAEAIPLPDGSVDAVVVAQAFHWFDGGQALPEIHRVLGPGGGLAMVWNVRDRTVDWVRRIADITEPHAGTVPRFRTGEWRKAFTASPDRFTPLVRRTYAHEHEVDAATMVERIRSISWIATLPEPEREDVLRRVEAVFDGMPPRFPAPYHTELWWCRAR